MKSILSKQAPQGRPSLSMWVRQEMRTGVSSRLAARVAAFRSDAQVPARGAGCAREGSVSLIGMRPMIGRGPAGPEDGKRGAA